MTNGRNTRAEDPLGAVLPLSREIWNYVRPTSGRLISGQMPLIIMIWNELLRAGTVPETDDNMKGDHAYGDFPNEDS